MPKEPDLSSQNEGIALPVDLIRSVAVILVILLHASIEAVPNLDIMSPQGVQLWLTSNFYDSIARPAVPLFIMLTGALLLQPSKKEEPLGVFFKKRWNRIGIPIFFWGTVFFVWDFTAKGQTLTLVTIAQGILAGPYVHFWYMYVLIGLYLITPLIRQVVAHTNWKDMQLYLVLWFIGTAVISLLTLFSDISPQAVWFRDNVFIFAGLIGYFVLGGYVVRLHIRRSILYLGLIGGFAWTFLGTYFLIGTLGEQYSQFFLDASSFSVIIASISLFLLLAAIPYRNLEIKNSRGNQILKAISQNSLPIYLFHVIVLETLQKGYLGLKISVTTINPIIEVPLITVLTLLICLAVIVPLKKLPHVNRIIG